jgi:non-homologous end joining protein Ku
LGDARRAVEVDGQLVTVSAEDIKEAKAAAVDERTIELQLFPADQLEANTLPSEHLYRLRPERKAKGAKTNKGNDQAYALLCQLVADPMVAFVAEVVVRSTSRMFRLVVQDGMLTLVELVRPSELADIELELPEVDDRMVGAGRSLMEAAVRDFDPEEWVDGAQVRLKALGERAAEDVETPVVEQSNPRAAAEQLVKLLKQAAA